MRLIPCWNTINFFLLKDIVGTSAKDHYHMAFGWDFGIDTRFGLAKAGP